MGVAPLALGFLLLATCGAADQTPGLHQDQRTNGPVPARYAIFLPKAYADEPTVRFPLVFLPYISRTPQIDAFTDWAEQQAVVVVGWEIPRGDFQAAPVMSVLETVGSTYRIEPALRFVCDVLGNAANAIANTVGTDWGGFVTSSSLGNQPKSKFGCIGQIAAPADIGFDPRISLAIDASILTRWGNPWRFSDIPPSFAGWQIKESALVLLDWMVQYQRLRHPALTPAALKAGQARLRLRIAELRASTEQPHRLAGSNLLLSLEQVAKGPDAPVLRTIWCNAALALAAAEGDLLKRHRRLEAISINDRASGLTPAERKQLQADLVVLRKDKTIRFDSEARAALVIAQKAADGRQSFRDAQSALRKVIIAFEEIGRRWPGTEAATIAAGEIARLEKELQ